MDVRGLTRWDVCRLSAGVIVTVWSASAAVGAAATDLTVDQIIARHIEASGGTQAWREIHTMAWTGRIESGRVGNFGVPFLLMFKRPNATHFEIMAQNQKSLRVFDGTMGWKLRPNNQGKPEWQNYTADEASFARDAAGLDGPLFDSREKGVSVVLHGTGTVEGHRAYRLDVTLPSGQVRTDWIDAESFLELRYDRSAGNASGQTGIVSVYYRNYKTIQGLVLPLTIETGNAAGTVTDKMMIDKVALNPTLPDNAFSKPTIASKRLGGVVIDTTQAPPPAARPTQHPP
jgi:outer membrane lipoprotein-sorting protein